MSDEDELSDVVCMQSEIDGEFTVCGDAFDLCKGDDPEAKTPVFAGPGDLITCPRCRSQIDACKKIKRWREPK
jgi:hypothetical protein